MKTISSTTGYLVEELEVGVDTEDLELTAPSPDAQAWEDLAAVFADGSRCAGCMFDERGVNVFTARPWRECGALDPSHCPVLNPATIANALRRQAG